jgi:integrase
MAAITPRKNDQGEVIGWQVRVRKKGWPTQTKTLTSKRDAQTWARRIEADIERGSFVSATLAEQTTFAELAQRFADEYAPHHYRGRGWAYKLQQLRKRLDAYSLAALTPSRVAEYRDDRLADADTRYRKTSHAKTVSPATVKTELDLLSKMLTVAQKEYGIPLPSGNPVQHIRKPKDAQARDRRLSESEFAALLDECERSRNPWLKAAVLFAVETAMRRGEMLGLKWNAIDLGRRIAMLTETKNGEARAVPLSSRAVEVLQGLPRSADGRVFPLESISLYHAFSAATKRAGIEDYRWHDLRHEAVSRLFERGDLSTMDVAAISGHKTLQMLKRYTQLRAEKLAERLG